MQLELDICACILILSQIWNVKYTCVIIMKILKSLCVLYYINFSSVPPKIKGNKLQKQTIVAGKDITFPVNFKGFPAPSITWTMDGNILPESSNRITVEKRAGFTGVKITSAETSDAGNYKLILKNEAGEIETACYVTIHGNCFPL